MSSLLFSLLSFQHRRSAIRYPELDYSARRAIWGKFFELAGILATEGIEISPERSAAPDGVMVDSQIRDSPISAADLDSLAEKPFNGLLLDYISGWKTDVPEIGRTIKNLVRTAQALALSS